jgi:hypothetical protein
MAETAVAVHRASAYPAAVAVHRARFAPAQRLTCFLQADIVQFQILSTDWKKQAYLLSDRTIELHSQASACCVAVPHPGL